MGTSHEVALTCSCVFGLRSTARSLPQQVHSCFIQAPARNKASLRSDLEAPEPKIESPTSGFCPRLMVDARRDSLSQIGSLFGMGDKARPSVVEFDRSVAVYKWDASVGACSCVDLAVRRPLLQHVAAAFVPEGPVSHDYFEFQGICYMDPKLLYCMFLKYCSLGLSRFPYVQYGILSRAFAPISGVCFQARPF